MDKIATAQCAGLGWKKMTEHVHQWHFDAFGNGIIAICTLRDCDMELTLKEVGCRLNATEKLTAAQARGAHKVIDFEGYDAPELLAYAAALEGEDS